MKYKNSVEFQVCGDYALFSDPITRVGGEKFSYQVPTYEALKGVLHSIYWKPTIIWIVDSVRIMKQIQTETKGIRPIKYNGGNDLSYYTYLKECCYQVKAHFIWNNNRDLEYKVDQNEHKHYIIAKRMIERGGRRDIFLGTRECQAYVEPANFGEGEGFYDKTPQLDFGVMYHGITYADEAYSAETRDHMNIRLWRTTMKYGVIDFIHPEECIHKKVRVMKMKKFVTDDNFSGLKEFDNDMNIID